MTTINSVLGPLDTTDLGFTLMHEHAILASAGVPQTYPELLGPGFKDRVVSELTKAREAGIESFVDATTIDLGRDVTLLAEISRLTGVNIIATTGFYHYMAPSLARFPSDLLAQLFIREIQEGIAGTDIKAGMLKAASDVSGVTEAEETILRGIARAHLQTKVPIMLHSYPQGEVGRRQLAILKEEGVDLSRVKVDHSNDTADMKYLSWLLEQGCYLGLDRYPGFNDVKAPARTDIMKALIDAGYGDHLLPSHDWTLLWDWPNFNPHGWLYMKNVVFAQLRDNGISEAVMKSLFVDNPRRFFEGV